MAYQKKRTSYSQASICFDCEKACGGCSWSEYDATKNCTRFKIPEGATFEPVYDVKGRIYTYRITKCPLFEKTPDRTQTNGMLSASDDERFLKDPFEYIKTHGKMW